MAYITFKSRDGVLSRRAVLPRVYKRSSDGTWVELSRIHVREVRHSCGEEPSLAILGASLGFHSETQTGGGSADTRLRAIRAESFSDSRLPQIGDVIRIEISRGTGKQRSDANDLGLFEGVVYSVVPEAWPDGEEITYTVYGPTKLLSSKIISGRYVKSVADEPELFLAEECVFNEWGVGNLQSGAGPDALSLLFSGKGDAQLWTLSAMVRYVIARYAEEAWLDTSAADGLAKLEEFKLCPPDVRIEGLTAAEALEDLLGRIGFSYAILPAGRSDPNRLLIFRKGGGTSVCGKAFRLQAAPETAGEGAALDIGASETNRFSIAFDATDVVDRIIATGAPDLSVGTWYLQAGWDTELEETATASKCAKPTANKPNSDWDTYKDVWRLWVVREDEDAPVHANFPDGNEWYRRPRRFISHWPVGNGESGYLRIWISTDGVEWQRYEGPVRILEDRMGLVFESVNIPAEDEENPGLAGVKVEAAVEVDSRLTVTLPETLPTDRPVVTRLVKCPDYLRVYDAEAKEYIYDDTESLRNYAAEKLAAVSRVARAASATVPFFTARFLPGDCVSGVEGRDIPLADDDALPYVRAVHWRFGDAESTEILVEDERFASAR